MADLVWVFWRCFSWSSCPGSVSWGPDPPHTWRCPPPSWSASWRRTPPGPASGTAAGPCQKNSIFRIRIKLGLWIRIQECPTFQEPLPGSAQRSSISESGFNWGFVDSDPGMQKWPSKAEKIKNIFMFSCTFFSFGSSKTRSGFDSSENKPCQKMKK